MSTSDVRFATAAELTSALRRRRISAVELALSTLDLLEKLGPKYNAVAALTRERALDEAKRADAALARKKGGALTGIPYGAKDLLAARGAPTTWGAPPYRDQIIGEDATAVAKLKRSGAVLAAKLAMVQLAGGGGYRYPSASLQGPGRNPWNTERWSGGSSSGSAAAVGAGLVPFAIGSETSGSIGTPSAYCGVTGLRPTYGLVSRKGAMALSWTLDKLGPMARTAEDCAAVLAAIAGSDGDDPTTRGRRFQPLAARAAATAAKRARIGFAEEDVTDHASPEARRALENGVAEFRKVAGDFKRATLPTMPYGPMVQTVYGAEGAEIFAELIEGKRFAQLVDARQKAGLRAALEIKARDYLHAMRLRARLRDALGSLFRDVDVILSVGRAITATGITQPLDDPPSTASGGPPPNKRPGNIGLIPAGNLAGVPAIFFPCGFATDGLPVGLQLVGPPFSEPLLVALASAYQRATDHHTKRPKD
ncbi:MAG TPA: amidase [Candidatus Limnocylindria bacterium]|nr:amidase [Candidatus Limnocylindria bacterium]